MELFAAGTKPPPLCDNSLLHISYYILVITYSLLMELVAAGTKLCDNPISRYGWLVLVGWLARHGTFEQFGLTPSLGRASVGRGQCAVVASSPSPHHYYRQPTPLLQRAVRSGGLAVGVGVVF